MLTQYAIWPEGFPVGHRFLLHFDGHFLGSCLHCRFIFNIGSFSAARHLAGCRAGKRLINFRKTILFQIAMADFAKNEKCPTSADLLAFQLGDLEVECGAEIREHLVGCEFCSAELAFYSRYPMDLEEEVTEPETIPAPLLELAEALLHHNSLPGSFDKLVNGLKSR